MKKKKNNLIIYLALSIIFLLVVLASYLVTNNFIIPIIIFLITLAYVIIYGYKKTVKHNEKLRRIEECYNFSYNFTIAINIKNSVDAAYESISDSLSLSLKEFLSTLEHEDRLTAIGHLRNYFKINTFNVFYRILLLYFEQGGAPITSQEGDVLVYNSKQTFGYDFNAIKPVLEEIGALEKAVKLNTGFVDRLVNGKSLDEEKKEIIKNARQELTETRNIQVIKNNK